MSVVAEKFSFVVGIDTHAKTYTFAIINTITGEEIANETFPVTVPGGRRALSWIQRRCQGATENILLTMEGTGSYGAKFRQQATDAGLQVTEAPFPQRRLGRLRGKSDAIDAGRAARATMGIPLEKVRDPRAGGVHLALRALTTARESMSRERTAAINSLNALLRTVELGADAKQHGSLNESSRWPNNYDTIMPNSNTWYRLSIPNCWKFLVSDLSTRQSFLQLGRIPAELDQRRRSQPWQEPARSRHPREARPVSASTIVETASLTRRCTPSL